ncbi:MAG TPA: hypothetical protein VN428_00485 [Bryobacteraceae bacterium]|nr:hypothetical protein [Bryobacteraceae bacterium]
MRSKVALLLLGVSLCLSAQMRMTVEQLVSFIKSSIKLNQQDKEVAKYVQKLTLSERLDERTIEVLQGQGAGPRTVEALRALAQASAALPPGQAPNLEPVKIEIPPPSVAEQEAAIRKAREYALNYIRDLPDFLCTQVTRRFYDPTGLEFWRAADTITARLSYVEDREDYKVILLNSRPMNTGMEAVGGAISTGEFGSMMKELFEPATHADFAWERWTTLRGRRTHVFRFRVTQANSKWHVTYERTQEIVPGYTGSVYIDRDTNAVVRIAFNAELPASFPIQQAGTVLDYDYADIGGQKFMLPLKAVVRMREGKALVKNDVEFRLYRKFAAEATLTFGEEETPAPLPEEKTAEQPPK